MANIHHRALFISAVRIITSPSKRFRMSDGSRLKFQGDGLATPYSRQ